MHSPQISNTEEALKSLGVYKTGKVSKHLKELNENGYTIFNFDKDDWKQRGIDIDKLTEKVEAIIQAEGPEGGKESNQYLTSGNNRGEKAKKGQHVEPGAQRLSNLISKGEEFLTLSLLPEILLCSQDIIGSKMRLSSIDLREPLKNCGNQELHTDVPDQTGKVSKSKFQCVSFLYLDDSTLENGPLRVIPGTHSREFKKSDHACLTSTHKDEIFVTVPKGSLVIANASIWHSGTNKINDDRRRVIFINYRHRDFRQQLNTKSFIDKKVIDKMDPATQYLLSVREQDKSNKLKTWIYYNRHEWYVKTAMKIKEKLLR